MHTGRAHRHEGIDSAGTELPFVQAVTDANRRVGARERHLFLGGRGFLRLVADAAQHPDKHAERADSEETCHPGLVQPDRRSYRTEQGQQPQQGDRALGEVTTVSQQPHLRRGHDPFACIILFVPETGSRSGMRALR